MYQDKASMPQNKPQKQHKKRLPKKITEKYLHNAGLAYLQRFAASKAHFIEVMMRKVRKSCFHHKDQDLEECATLVCKTADKFEELGLLNDEAYLRGMVASLRRRGLSARAIIQKLQMKGLSQEQTKYALTVYDAENGYEENADIIAALTYCRKKRMGPFANSAPDEKQFGRWLSSLGRQGFSYDVAKSILAFDKDEAEDQLYATR